ncbi:MAG: hypothetical protein ACE5EC_02445 [Phycisphaerae bacterium]
MDRHPCGGGWPATRDALDVAGRVGWLRLWRALRSKNACKTCALGMGGQKGGMRNELGRWPEVCKKSLQAMAADMQDGLRPEFFRRYGLDAHLLAVSISRPGHGLRPLRWQNRKGKGVRLLFHSLFRPPARAKRRFDIQASSRAKLLGQFPDGHAAVAHRIAAPTVQMRLGRGMVVLGAVVMSLSPQK